MMRLYFIRKVILLVFLLAFLFCSFTSQANAKQCDSITCPPNKEKYPLPKGSSCPDKCTNEGVCVYQQARGYGESEMCCCDPAVVPKLTCGSLGCNPSNDKCPPSCPCHSSSDGNWCGARPTLEVHFIACDPCGCKGDSIEPKDECQNCDKECKKCTLEKAKGGTEYEKGGAWTALGCIPTGDFSEFTAWLLRRIIAIAGGIAFLLVIVGGFKIITSAGDPKGVQAAKETITSALIGLLFIIFSVFLLELIGVKILGIPSL